MVLEVPSKSHLEISIEFEKSLLKWLEYPPDANKGFYVNSALISTVLEDKTNFTGKMVHTGYIEVIMQGKCGRNTETTFDIK